MFNQIAGSASATVPPSAAKPAGAFANSDFQTFLKMLTTQITNQDPLNPMEGSDFAVQLATFSGVEQQVRTNDLLSALAGQMSGGLGRVADWIGKEVRTTAPVHFSGNSLTISITPAPDAENVVLVAYDAQGRVASREAIGKGSGDVDWVGRDAQGRVLPAGRYSFQVESWRGDEMIATSSSGAYAKVVGAEMTSGGIKLSLNGGATTMEEDVTALRATGA